MIQIQQINGTFHQTTINEHLVDAFEQFNVDVQHGPRRAQRRTDRPNSIQIVTTIDAQAQTTAKRVIAELPEDRPDNNRMTLISLDPNSGAIVALYGGPDYVSQSRNAATQDVAQASSTFKPFTLIAALQKDIPLSTRFPSYTPMDIDEFDRPMNNYDTVNRGTIDLITTTTYSVNTSYALLNVEVGPKKRMQVAIDTGLPENTPGLTAVPSNDRTEHI